MTVGSAPQAPSRPATGWAPGLRTAWPWALTATTVLWGVVAVGVLLRVVRYALDRSLWIDEVFLALNLLHRSSAELLKPLDYFQGAPAGFLLAERAVVRVLGGGEYALRLIPLAAGVLAVPLFVVLARRLDDPVAQLVSVVCFALSSTLVYYSSQVKPYTVDVLVATALLWLAWPCLSPGCGRRRLVRLAVLGVVAPWLSLASGIMLASIWVVLLGARLARRRFDELAGVLAVGAVWLASGAAEYALTLRHLRAVRISPTLPDSGYVPHSPADGSWYANSVMGLFRTTLGVPRPLAGAAVLVFLVGCVALWRRNRAVLALLVVPVVMALLAAVAHLYGFGSRFSLFLVPSLVLVIGSGVSALIRVDRRRETLVGVLAAALIAGGIAVLAFKDVASPSNEEIKPVLSYISHHRRPGDTIFVDYWAQYAYAYYAHRYGLPVGPVRPAASTRLVDRGENSLGYPAALRSNPPRLLIGPNQGYFTGGLRGLDGIRRRRRVWLLFSHGRPGAKLDEESLYRVALSRSGHLRKKFQAQGADVYLWRR
jgi:hypothetical protein